ncbi:natterin-4-like [Anticarsia gemmatalis]|uniref:natterin-4-like n=1 Tax=Anticarsia gemmatalis TaxID=129554 RepID=UPI003F75CE7E
MCSLGGPVWVKGSNGSMPDNAVPVGVDVDGRAMYIARARHDKYLVPGKIIPSRDKHMFLPYDGKEHSPTEYEVLVNHPNHWVKTSGSNIPPNAIPAGSDRGDETIYIGRARIEGTLTVGKVHPSHGVCYLSYAGKEHHFPNYEILVNCGLYENEGIVPGSAM